MTNKKPKKQGSRSKLREFFIANAGKILNSETPEKGGRHQ